MTWGSRWTRTEILRLYGDLFRCKKTLETPRMKRWAIMGATAATFYDVIFSCTLIVSVINPFRLYNHGRCYNNDLGGSSRRIGVRDALVRKQTLAGVFLLRSTMLTTALHVPSRVRMIKRRLLTTTMDLSSSQKAAKLSCPFQGPRVFAKEAG